MTKKQNNKRAMYEAVLSLLETNSAKTSSNQGIGESAGSFKDLLEAINVKAVQVAQATVGKTAAKRGARAELMAVLVPVTAGLYALGRKQGDPELKAAAGIPRSSFERMRDTYIGTAAGSILDLAKQHASDLPVHGVTGEMITSLEGRIAGFYAAIGERQSSVAAGIAGRKTLEELFTEVDRVLDEEIDKYLEFFRDSQSEFYKAYFSARMIHKFGVRHQAKPALKAVEPQPDTKKAA